MVITIIDNRVGIKGDRFAIRKQRRMLLDVQGQAGRAVVIILFAATILAAALFMLETVAPLQQRYHRLFAGAEVALAGLFTLEYILRLISARRPLAYAFSFWGMVDLLSSLPAFLLLPTGTLAARSLRLFRLAQMLKLLRIGNAYERILTAFRAVAGELVVFLGFASVLLYFAAMGIYLFEHEAQPEAFRSAPASLWWAAVTLTTVGYGDVYPITTGGRIFTGALLLIGLSVVAVPTGLFSSAVIEVRRKQDQDSEAQVKTNE